MTIKNWTYAYNQVPENQTTLALQAASLHKARKDFLVAGGWTVTRSSDGDINTSDIDGDHLTDVATDFIFASSGGRTWMELKSPEGFWAGLDGTYAGDQSRMWVTIHLNSTNAYTAEIYFHNTEPTGTASKTACPTSTNKVGYAAQQMLRSTFNATYPAIFHFIRTSQGSWCEFVGYYGSGYMPYSLIVAPITEVNHSNVSGLDYPFGTAIWAGWRDTNRGACELNPTWYYVGGIQNNYNYQGSPFANNWRGWYKDATPLTSLDILHLAYQRNESFFYVNWFSISHYYTIGQDFAWATRDAFSYEFPTSELVVMNNTPGKQFRIGKIADIYGTYAAVNQGDVDDSENPTQAFIGNLVFPTNTNVSMV